MNKHIGTIAVSLVLLTGASASAQRNGYYKDIFMDGGINLSSTRYLPSATSLGLTIEDLRTAKSKDATFMDSLAQKRYFICADFDANGYLLYPDGAPRFKMMFVNGGSARLHGRSLLPEGRRHVREFVKAGGSYLGNCAGAYVATTGTHKTDSLGNPYFNLYDEYIGIYPGVCTNAELEDTPVGIFVPKDSPMLEYHDFGGDFHIANVYHNGGCFMDYGDLIPGAEILFEYDFPSKKMHGNGAVWAWKENEMTGRVMCSGPHPENQKSGERLEMMEAMVLYCLDGAGVPRIKGELLNGEARNMVKSTEECDPAYTMIGDKQYHHFKVDVPEGTDTLKITLKSLKNRENYDLFLFGNYGGFAFFDNATFRQIKRGIDKELVIACPRAGELYISVFCDTTVDTAEDPLYGTVYSGRLDVLNGVPYILTARFGPEE